MLNKVTDADLGNNAFPWLTGQEIDVAGVSTRALRVSYAGELGWELHHPMAQMEELYDALMAAGVEFGIANFGVYALNSLRMEKGYCGWGSELTNELTMVEADMERFVKMKKDDFVGRDALIIRKEERIATKLVYLTVDADDADCMGNEPIIADGRVVGVTTSGGYGHEVGQSLAFAYVEPVFAEPGTTLEVIILDQAQSVTVVAEPLHDAENERLRV